MWPKSRLGPGRTQKTENIVFIQESSYIKWHSTFTILQTTINPFQMAKSNLPAHLLTYGFSGGSGGATFFVGGFIPRYTHLWHFFMLLSIPPLFPRARIKSKHSRRHRILTLRIHNYTIWNILYMYFKQGLFSSGSRHASYICTTITAITKVAALPSRFDPQKWFNTSTHK